MDNSSYFQSQHPVVEELLTNKYFGKKGNILQLSNFLSGDGNVHHPCVQATPCWCALTAT